MQGKLIMSYYSNVRKIPESFRLVSISSYCPPIEGVHKDRVIRLNSLAPSKEILTEYQNTKDWDKFVKDFNEYTYRNKEFAQGIKVIKERLRRNEDVCLLCFEKDYTRCHRSLVALILGKHPDDMEYGVKKRKGRNLW